MKALITDEYRTNYSVIDGPNNIIMNLKNYLLEFDRYGHSVSWGTEEFVEYLNKVILKDKSEKVIIIELLTNDCDEDLPVLYI